MLLWQSGEGEGAGRADPRTGIFAATCCDDACGRRTGIDGIRIRSSRTILACTCTGSLARADREHDRS